MHFYKMLISVLFFSLSACGGGGSSGSGGGGSTPPTEKGNVPAAPAVPAPVPSTASASYENMLREFTDFVGRANVDNRFDGRIISLKDMQATGTAQYRGNAILSVGECVGESSPHLLGKTTLTADFTNSKITGHISEFSAVGKHSTTGGELNLTGDILGNKIKGKLIGSVNFDAKNFAIDDEIDGVFLSDPKGVVLTAQGKSKDGDNYSATIAGINVAAKP